MKDGGENTEEEQFLLNEDLINPTDLLRQEDLSILELVVAEKQVNKEALRTTMSSVWKLKDKADFKEVGLNTYVVKLQNLCDFQKVQEGRLWTFDSYLFCFTQYDGFLTPQQFEFKRTYVGSIA